jgi:AcrR family transcriptional regulator
MADVAAEAGFTKPALYAHFPNKSALADALAQRIAVQLAHQIAGLVREDRPLREVVHELVDTFCEFVDYDPELFGFLAQGALGLGRRANERRLVAAAAELAAFGVRRVAEQTGSDPVPATTWGYAMVGAVFYAVDWWSQTRSISRAELVEHLTDAAWAVMSVAGAERMEGPLVPPEQASIFVSLITRQNNSVT